MSGNDVMKINYAAVDDVLTRLSRLRNDLQAECNTVSNIYNTLSETMQGGTMESADQFRRDTEKAIEALDVAIANVRSTIGIHSQNLNDLDNRFSNMVRS